MSTVPCRGAGCTRTVHVATPHQMCDDCMTVLGWQRGPVAVVTSSPPAHDPVTRPAHYTAGKVECIDAIRSALGLEGFVAYCRGNAIKYNWRAELKHDNREDLEKAGWYTARAVAALKEEAA